MITHKNYLIQEKNLFCFQLLIKINYLITYYFIIEFYSKL
jgi:hypothetical protein